MHIRLPAVALAALRRHVERFLRAHGVREGQLRGDAELDVEHLGHMLPAALRHAREAHPWLGRRGAILDPPGDDPPELPFAVAAALPGLDAPLTVDACIAALRRVVPFTVDHTPCGGATPVPRAYPYRQHDGIGDAVGIVADDDWLADPPRRDLVFCAALPANDEPMHFVALTRARAVVLAGFLLAGPARRDGRHAHGARAAEFVVRFGAATLCFASTALDDDALADPFAHGSAWSRRDNDGHGSWGQALALVATDGLRVAWLDALWDVTAE